MNSATTTTHSGKVQNIAKIGKLQNTQNQANSSIKKIDEIRGCGSY